MLTVSVLTVSVLTTMMVSLVSMLLCFFENRVDGFYVDGFCVGGLCGCNVEVSVLAVYVVTPPAATPRPVKIAPLSS